MLSSKVKSVYFVPGKPHILLANKKNSKWDSLNKSYGRVKEALKKDKPDSLLIFSTSWLSVIGHLLQGDPNPKHHLVDHNWHDFGTMDYDIKVDTDLAKHCGEAIDSKGYTSKLVNYKAFPIDTGTIVAEKLLNPENEFPASMISCNIYADRKESFEIGEACREAIEKSGKNVSVVIVSSLSNRFFTHDIDPEEDKISTQKDDYWNQKILGLFEKGSVSELSDIANEFAKKGNADMGFKSMWWLEGVLGKDTNCHGRVFDYQAVWGTGGAICSFHPTEENKSMPKQAKTEEKETNNILSEKAPLAVGAYPHAKEHGDLIFLSGIGPRRKGTKEIPGLKKDELLAKNRYDITLQTESVIQNLKYILEDSGSSLEDILDITVYLLDMENHFEGFNKVYSKYFSKEKGPARTTLEVSKLPTDIGIEFKVSARKVK